MSGQDQVVSRTTPSNLMTFTGQNADPLRHIPTHTRSTVAQRAALPPWLSLRHPLLKELFLTFVTGILLFFALGLLFDHEEAGGDRPASTAYGEF
jgi:hypothetical protein